ncbi:transposase [Methylobacterium sp. P31]
MPGKRFSNEQIAFALWQAENGVTVDEVCRKMGASEPTCLTLEEAVRRHGRAGDPAAQAAGGGEQQARAAGRRPDAGPLHACQDVLKRRW